MSTSSQPSFPSSQTVNPNSTLAITSMVSGILGWTFLPIIGAILAILTGHMAKSEIKKSDGRLAGDGIATAGMILGYTSAIFGLCLLAVLVFAPALLWLYGDRILEILR